MGIVSINEPQASRTWMVRPPSINEPNYPPVVTDMQPTTAVLGDPDFELTFTGTGFDPVSCFIAFAGQREPARFNGDGTIFTIVKPSLAWGEVTVKASVYNGDQPSQEFDFTFTAVAAGQSRAKHAGHADPDAIVEVEDPTDPDQLEDELEQAEEEGDFKSTHASHKKKGKRK